MGAGNNQPTGEVAVEVTGVFPRLRPLPPVGPLRSLGSSKLPGHSGIQLQVGDVFLDPVLIGVGTDLPASSGLEDDTWLGTLAAGLKIVDDVCTWNLPRHIGEAAGGRGVSTSWCRQDLAAEGHGAEEDGQGSLGDLHDAEQMNCEFTCQESRDGSRHSLLAAFFCFAKPSPLLFIGSPVDEEMESWGEVGNF